MPGFLQAEIVPHMTAAAEHPGDVRSAGPVAFNPEVRETHCAVVFFLGDRAYKVKKPVNLGFLDFTTAEARRAVCHRELELNRRLAPDVYLDVAELTDGSGVPREWILVMRRMPQDRRLSTLVENGINVNNELRALAKMLAAFHAKAIRSQEIDQAGTARGLGRRWSNNFDELRSFRGDPIDPSMLDEAAERSMRYLRGRNTLFDSRVQRGLTCDGHGDLIADDIFCLTDGPRALDCLEFDDHLRWVDGVDDAAFLAMDLERIGAPGLGTLFLDFYSEFAPGPRTLSLEHHYIAYRAVVRAKVAALRFRQGVDGQADLARALTGIAVTHLRAGEPRLILVGGLPGTGKSTLAGRLADELHAVVLRSDRIRKENQHLAPESPAAADWLTGIYRPETTAETYGTLLHRSRELLCVGETVVLDASWRDEQWRCKARQLASECSSLITELRCEAPAPVAVERLRRRIGTGDPSDADIAIARQMAQSFAAWPESVTIDTGASLERSIEKSRTAIGSS